MTPQAQATIFCKLIGHCKRPLLSPGGPLVLTLVGLSVGPCARISSSSPPSFPSLLPPFPSPPSPPPPQDT